MEDGDLIDLRTPRVTAHSARTAANDDLGGGPGASTPDSEEELDWSWLEEIKDDEVDAQVEAQVEAEVEEEMRDLPSFRASMRRMRPFRLSSRQTVMVEDEEGVPEVRMTAEEANQEENRSEERNESSAREKWPHSLSSMFACLGCTVGLFNISRFAVLSIHFGANFIIQFIILSLLFGLPLYSFHVSIGQYLGAGVIDMWRISPVFQGVGIALLVLQALLGIYSIVGVSWMFVYLRDSFITKNDIYRWAVPLDLHREENAGIFNGTYKIEETVPDYFSGVVLQRRNLSSSENHLGRLKFQLVFNLAVVWMIIFVCLCKGLKSYGKVVYVIMPLGLIGVSVLSFKIVGITPLGYIFYETVWSEFFLNSKSWVAAAVEAFFTWSLFGACAMQITSHNAESEKQSMLRRDTILVALLTILILVLAALLGNACIRTLRIKGNYEYMPSSFEKMSSYGFLWPPLPEEPVATSRYMTHVPLAMGVQVAIPLGPIHFGWTQSGELELVGDVAPSQRSGYQTLRLATEIVPAALALFGTAQLSPFWAVLFYFSLIVFGIAQQLAIWHCVITGITAINLKTLKVWETTITFFACVIGFLLGLPLATELGIFLVHFVDYCVGCGWWAMALYLTELGSVLVIRGRPYGGENVVTVLFPSLRAENSADARQRNQPSCLATWAAPTLAFAWNVMLPVALMVLSITVFKNGNFRSLYNWSEPSKSGSSLRGFDNPYIHFRAEDFEHTVISSYWPVWSRKIGTFLQILPLLTVPFTAIIQTVRYLSSGSPDLFERMQALYRPHSSTVSQGVSFHRSSDSHTRNNGPSNGTVEDNFEDPPPKYTPPPSYTTATGARIAKLLRQSFRRSIRRLASALGDAEGSQGNMVGIHTESGDGPRTCSVQNRLSLPQIPNTTTLEHERSAPQLPPDYASVLVEIRQALRQNLLPAGRSLTNELQAHEHMEDLTEMQRTGLFVRRDSRRSTATAESVATLLRSSQRKSKKLKPNATEISQDVNSSTNSNSWRSSLRGSACGVVSVGRRASESAECLVEGTIQRESSTVSGEVNLGLDDLGILSTAI